MSYPTFLLSRIWTPVLRLLLEWREGSGATFIGGKVGGEKVAYFREGSLLARKLTRILRLKNFKMPTNMKSISNDVKEKI